LSVLVGAILAWTEARDVDGDDKELLLSGVYMDFT
jgi:hypothetical protein